MNTGDKKILIVVVFVLLFVLTAGCVDMGIPLNNYHGPNLCHGALQNLTFAKLICHQHSALALNTTVTQTPAAGP
jgi:hypothetical protein